MVCATVLLLRLTECGSRPVKWQQRKAILEDGTIKLRQTSAYQVKYDHDMATEVSLNDAAVAIVYKDNTWSNTHEMMDPLTDMLCCFKKGAGSVSMEQLFSPGEGPRKTHVVSQPKKQDQNVFYQLGANMKGLPSAELPRLDQIDTHFLDASEDARFKKRRNDAKERLSKAASPTSGKKHKVCTAASIE